MRTKKELKSTRHRRKRSIRKKIMGTPSRPRLTVYRSNKHIYVQAIDDLSGHTLASASSLETIEGAGDDIQARDLAREVGKLLAERVKEKGVDQVVFDRNGFVFHGRVAAAAEGAREGGLKF